MPRCRSLFKRYAAAAFSTLVDTVNPCCSPLRSSPSLCYVKPALLCTSARGSTSQNFLGVPSFGLNYGIVLARIQHFKNSADLENALEELDLTLNYPLVRDVLQNLADSPKLALRFLLWAARQPGYKPTCHVYDIMVEVLLQSQQLRHIMSLVTELKHDGLLFTPNTFVVIMELYDYAGMRNLAMLVFHQMERLCCRPTASSYNALLRILCKSKNLKVAKDIFHTMGRSRCSPNSETFSILITEWLKCNQMKEARWFLKKSLKRKAFASPESIAFLLNRLCRDDNNVNDARDILIKALNLGCPVNMSCFNTVIRKYCQFKKKDEVRLLVEKMEALGYDPDNVTYALLVRLYEADLDKVRELLDAMTRKGLKHDGHTLHCFVVALCRRRRIKEACKVFEGMHQEGFTPDVGTYTVIIDSLCTIGRAVDALKVFREMEGRSVLPNIQMFGVLIRAFCREGDINEALKLFDQLDDMGIIPTIGIFRLVEKQLRKASRIEEAELLFHRMLLKGYNQKLRLHVNPKDLKRIFDQYGYSFS